MVPMIIQQPGQMPTVWNGVNGQFTVLATPPAAAQGYAPRPQVQGHVAYSQPNAHTHENVQAPNAAPMQQQPVPANASAMSQPQQPLPQSQPMQAPQQPQQQPQPHQQGSFPQIAPAAAAAPYYP